MRRRAGMCAVGAAMCLMVVLAAPSGASAAESCVYQGLVTSDSRDRARPKSPALDRRTKVEHSLLCLTNVHRIKNGLATLKLDTRLAGAARGYSADMVARGFFDHTSPEGTGPSERAAAAGYPGGAGENLAANGTGTALSLFQQWLGSPGHNANMLGANYMAAGFGVATGFPGGGQGGVTGTQMFGLDPANGGYDGLDLYASNERCAAAKLRRLNARENLVGKKGVGGKVLRVLAKTRKVIRKACRPPG